MKKLLIFTLLAVLSCSKEQTVSQTISDDQLVFTLNGYVLDSDQAPDTKIGIGNQTPSGWPIYWTAGDDLRCRTAAAAGVGIAKLKKGAGQPYGEFEFTVLKPQTEGTQIRFVYPASAWCSFTTNTLPSEQVQGGEKDGSANISKYAFAVADMTYSASLPTEFKLRHIYSYVCIKLSSKAYEGLAVKSATLSCEGAALSGTFGTNYSTLAVTPQESKDYVKANLETPLLLTQTPKLIWLACLPCDLTGKTATLKLEGEFCEKKVTLPIEIPGQNLKAGYANVIDLSNLSNQNLSPKWYDPADGRKMTGAGYAYGPANTFLIQCRNGSTYTGATYSPVDKYKDTIRFDFKARGDLSKVRDPKNFKFGWATKTYKTEQMATAGSVYYPRTNEFTKSNNSPKGYKFEVDRENYIITVINVSAHAGSPILLMLDEDDNIVWGWAFWNIAADGTKLEPVTVSGYSGSFTIANMDIGQPTTDYAAFAANKTTVSGQTVTDQVGRFIHKYQWGRYLPIFWNPTATLCWSDGSASSANIPAIKGPVSLEDALKHPYGLIAGSLGTSIKDWQSEPEGDLWGGLSSSYVYVQQKTNYDPCPQGWMVPDARTTIKWKEYANKASLSFVTEAGQKGILTGGTYFAASGTYSNSTVSSTNSIAVKGMALDGSGNECSWWGAHSYRASGTPNIWAYPNTSTSSPGVIYSGCASATEDYYHSDFTYGDRARAFSVRCSKDRYNR